jgi:hypothetical protein
MNEISAQQTTDMTAATGAGQAAPVATLGGRGCPPRQVVEELPAALAADPSIVVCDLGGQQLDVGVVLEVLDEVPAYVAQWPGTVVAVCTPDTRVRERVRRSKSRPWLVVGESQAEAVAAARGCLPRVRRRVRALHPEPGSCRDARRFIGETLRLWNLPGAVEPALQVGHELVANAAVHAHSVMELRLSHAAASLRVAVYDDADALPSLGTAGAEQLTTHGRGLQMVQAFSRGWGVLPGRPVGKTVWAVLEAAPVGADAGSARAGT